MRTVPVVLSLALLGSLACGPMIMIPGGALSGNVTATPTDWSFSDSVDTVQLETNPDDPYSVNVWGVAAGPTFYIASGDKDSEWANNMRSNPLVKLRIGDALYQLQAEELTEASDRAVFLAAIKKKYDFEPDEDEQDGSSLFRLSAR